MTKIQEPPDAEATAPGDIPMPMIEQRLALLAQQFRHDNTIRPYAPHPHEPVTVTASSGLGVDVAYAEVWYTTDGRLPDAHAHRLPLTAVKVEWQPRAGFLTQWQAEIPGQVGDTAVRYRIAGWHTDTPPDAPPDLFAQDGQGFWSFTDDGAPVTTFAYYVEPDAPAEPDWMADAVIYHIFLDRYHPGNGDGRFPANLEPNARHGGTLRGVTQTLPYLAELGITCLWLSPLNISHTYHRYDATDLFVIDPELGTDEDLHELIRESHARGIRVILDFVPSHISWKHPAFQAAQADQNADTASWFVFHEWPHSYRCFLGLIPFLVSLDTNDPAVRAHLIENARYWIREFDVDGFRLDHAIGHGMDFWVEFRTAVQSAKPDAVTIGEATDSPDALQRYKGRLTHLLDFQLATALRQTFATGQWDVARLDNFLRLYEQFMAEGPDRASFLDNHDMNRFLFLAGDDVDRLKMAALCQFTLAPTPIIYYGTEIGMSQPVDKDADGFGGDHHVRQDMPWDAAHWDTDLLAFYRQLIGLRREYGLGHGRRQRLFLDPTTQTYAYRQGNLVAAFNLSMTSQLITLPQAGAVLLTTGQQPILQEQTVAIPAQTAVILKL